MTRCAIFDIDDTLYAFKPCQAVALAKVRERAAESGLCPDPAAWDAAYDAAFKWQFSRHGDSPCCHHRGIRFQRMLESLGLRIGAAFELERLFWETLVGCATPAPGAAELLSRIHSSGVRIGVGTNMTASWQILKLLRLGLEPFVDFAVTSEEADAEKPSPEFFALVLEKAGCAPEECVFVGDNLELDALAARAAGMRGVWLQPDPAMRAARPDVESIASLSDLRV